MAVDLLLCVATEVEGAAIARRLKGDDVLRGVVAGKQVALVRTGVGPVNAAYGATRFLTREPARAVIVCGVGGAYPSSGLEVGEVVCAETELYADLGARTDDGFLDMEALGFPVIEGEQTLYNRLPLSLFPAARRVPFVTTTTCTGTDEVAEHIAARTGGAVESMEGAAFVHVALLHGAAVGEVRGISNHVGKRDRGSWRVKEAARLAQATVLKWLESQPW